MSGTLDSASRTAKVRCTFANAEHLLKPEMYATLRLSVEQKKALAIPRSAILRLGEYRVVFLEEGEAEGRTRFGRVPVEVDESEADAWLEVKRGVQPGQRVVTSGAIILSQQL